MGIIQAPAVLPGQVGVLGAIKYMVTSDNLATITTAGYMNNIDLAVFPLLLTDILGITYNYVIPSGTGTFGFFTVSITNGVITLVAQSGAGGVLLPVVNGNFPIFNGTTGQVKDSGQSASSLVATKIAAVSGATVVDHLLSAADTAGTIKDSGVVASAVQLSANIKGARTGNIGGGGAGPISVIVGGITAASIVTGTINTSTNPASIQKMTATATGFDILFSADPGATCTVNYVVIVAAQ